MRRQPYVAGQFYPASPSALKKQIQAMTEEKSSKEKAKAVVSPHAGYVYSGAVAGAVFSRVEVPDTVIILGPNHTARGPVFSLMEKGVWEMPFGNVEIDSALAESIAKKCSLIKVDESAHTYEHSLEVQVPFIQYFNKSARIVPFILREQNISSYIKLAEAIASAIRESKKDTLIVASSDMTHYETQESANKKDKLAIDAILKLDEKLLLENIKKYGISMCGYVPAVIAIIAAKLLGAKKGELVKYQTSGDVSGDYNEVVGYAGIIIK